MTQPRLSILIPSVPTRFHQTTALYRKIMNMIGDMDIEVLMFMDNKKRTIGEKRESLKNISQGKYFLFVDDDDDLVSIKPVYEAAMQDVDVITYKQRCRNQDGSNYIITFGLGNEIEHNTENGRYKDSKRPPFHVCAWNEKFKSYQYPAVNYAEDWGWLKQVIPLAKTEIHIPEIVHSYNFDINVSEASTESNPEWKNPNEVKPQPPRIKRRAIVNLVTRNSPHYIQAQARLIDSLTRVNSASQFDVYTIIGEESVSADPHSQNPYAFKINAIQMVRDQGYDQVFWFDASIVATKDLTPIWQRLEQNGIFMEEAGHWAGTWCNDYALKYFGLTREQAMTIPMFAAGYVGFDFTHPDAIEFFAAWRESMLNGCFKGSWSDHRHDMTCASIIAHKMGITNKYGSGGEFFAYIGPSFSNPKPTVVAELRGI